MKGSTYAVAALLLVSSLAHAHSQLTSSTPADKASLASAPKEIVLHFSGLDHLDQLLKKLR